MSLTGKQVRSLRRAWWHADSLGLRLNVYVTITDRAMNDIDPALRFRVWQIILNKIGQFARDNRFTAAFIWTRESRRPDGQNEHLHALLHVPPKMFARFRRLMEKWTTDDDGLDIDVQRSDYKTHDLGDGKKGSVFDYITKNSPQAAYGGTRIYRPGGPIVGKRCGCSRNLQPAYAAHHMAAQSWIGSAEGPWRK